MMTKYIVIQNICGLYTSYILFLDRPAGYYSGSGLHLDGKR
jgi:hypothetical protein